MEDDVQHVEANRIQASSQEVVQSRKEKMKYVVEDNKMKFILKQNY